MSERERDVSEAFPDGPRIAIVHDFLLYPGGAESVLRVLMRMYPDAPVYTLLYDEERYRDILGEDLADRTVYASFLQKSPGFVRKRHRWLLPFYAAATESLDLREYDVVISSSGAWSKGLVTRLYTKHIAYIHSPMRYIWDENERYMRRAVGRGRFFVRQLLSYLRVWDYQAAQRPDVLVANSLYTADRIGKYYRLPSELVYPPVAIPEGLSSLALDSSSGDHSDDGSGDGYFVIISRLVPYKNIQIAIDVCNKLSLPLKIIGDGPHEQELRQIAGETIEFLEWCSEDRKWEVLSGARALIFPAVDDFGIVCVESLGAGVPVIMVGKGGAREIVLDGEHGIHCAQPTVEVLADGFRRFLEVEKDFDPNVLRERAGLFSQAIFEKNMRRILQKTVDGTDHQSVVRDRKDGVDEKE